MACSRTLTGIAMECTPSKGGIVEAYVTNWAEGIFKYDTDSGSTGDVEIPKTITGITDSASTVWQKLAFRKNISNYTSTMNIDDANGVQYVSTDINLIFNKMQTSSRIAINAMALTGLALVVKDANGKYWGFGATEPVMLTAGSGESGTAATDANRYSVTLTDTDAFLPMELTADAVAEINFGA